MFQVKQMNAQSVSLFALTAFLGAVLGSLPTKAIEDPSKPPTITLTQTVFATNTAAPAERRPGAGECAGSPIFTEGDVVLVQKKAFTSLVQAIKGCFGRIRRLERAVIGLSRLPCSCRRKPIPAVVRCDTEQPKRTCIKRRIVVRRKRPQLKSEKKLPWWMRSLVPIGYDEKRAAMYRRQLEESGSSASRSKCSVSHSHSKSR